MKTITLAAALAAAALSVPASAATISGLFNTGVDDLGAVLNDGDAELHYKVNGSDTPILYNNGAYVQAPDAHYIAVDSGGGYTDPVNVYTLTFDLGSLDPASASLSGLFAADDEAIVTLNGTGAQTATGFSDLQSFSFNSGFVSGVNTLSFQVTDLFGQPSAFVVSGLSGTVGAVPEPASWAMLILGVGGVGGSLRRRRVAFRFA